MAALETFLAVQKAQNDLTATARSVEQTMSAIAFIAFVVLVVGTSALSAWNQRPKETVTRLY